MKLCSKCKLTKESHEFGLNPKTSSGLKSWCKKCNQEAGRLYQALNKEASSVKKKLYRDINRDKIKLQKHTSHMKHRDKILAKHKEYRKNNQAKVKKTLRNSFLKKTYGLTLDTYSELLSAQNNVCAICNKANASGRSLHVDHNHSTGKIRELLCNSCNSAIGYAKEDISVLERIILYLKKHNES